MLAEDEPDMHLNRSWPCRVLFCAVVPASAQDLHKRLGLGWDHPRHLRARSVEATVNKRPCLLPPLASGCRLIAEHMACSSGPFPRPWPDPPLSLPESSLWYVSQTPVSLTMPSMPSVQSALTLQYI